MVENSFYLSDPNNLELAMEMTGLAEDELEEVVGRFTKNSCRAGQLRGEVVRYYDGKVAIRHHFHKNRILWRE